MTTPPGEAWPAATAERALADLLRAFPRVVLRVTGGCMSPAIPEGAEVVLEDARRSRPRFGDVVLSRQPDGLRLHRLVWAPCFGRWRTQADRAGSADPALTRDEVLARVVSVVGGRSPACRRRLALRALCARARRLLA
jgi:hypothetical protein